MRLVATNPAGAVTALDLASIRAYRLLLADQGEYLGVGIRYLAGAGAGTAAFGLLMLAAITIPSIPPGSFEPITRVGLPTGDQAKDKERLKEAMRVLYNTTVKTAVVDTAIEQSTEVVDFFWWLRPLLFGATITERQERGFERWHVAVLP